MLHPQKLKVNFQSLGRPDFKNNNVYVEQIWPELQVL